MTNPYKNSVAALNKIRAAEIEMLRFRDPRESSPKSNGMPQGEFDQLKEKALELETDPRKKLNLSGYLQLNNYKSYFSEMYEEKKEEFEKVKAEADLENVLNEERVNAEFEIKRLRSMLETELQSVRADIMNLINKRLQRINPIVKQLQDIEEAEDLLYGSSNPFVKSAWGVSAYLPEIKSNLLKPKKVGYPTFSRLGTGTYSDYKNYLIVKDILGGLYHE
ncbi:hypothetical protein [Globicatella sp. PHS-GS-PNBC-21-1553]|uniref:hypothetical protein n=1 Tax=Globicatella sp. PHS-GS-PNBC-21-1553 TaxID=2885764 RepID=UPI00298ED8BE|nr:hypothetical protein [Globicatella sp. PHS-GS-PNBC-21-1553]WPC08798.1 hypothetical protein LB888_00635 [Globicatella sp. PHS-GS-PNBC-21-1553]